jgi:Fungal N-terminal domain of STAND proteins
MDPVTLTTGIIALITVAINLVTSATDLIDRTVTAHRDAADVLQELQGDLERLKKQINQIHGTLQILAADTKDRAFKKLLREYVLPSYIPT